MYVLRTMNSLRTSFWIVPGELRRRHALLLGGDDVEREHRQHGAVHRHRHAHLVERDAVEQLAHVEDRVDRHAGHADVAGDTRVVAVVAAVRGEVEGDRQALLAGGQVAAVERVGLLGRGEPGVLADRPRLVRRTSSGTGRAGTAARPGYVSRKSRPVEVGGGVERRRRRCPRASPTRRVATSPAAAAQSSRIAGRASPAQRDRRRSRGSLMAPPGGRGSSASVARTSAPTWIVRSTPMAARSASARLRAAGEVHGDGAGVEQRLGDGDGLLGVDRVARAQAGDGGAAGAERVGDGRRVVGDRPGVVAMPATSKKFWRTWRAA